MNAPIRKPLNQSNSDIMGTWGTGYFGNDAALDFMEHVEDSEDPNATIRKALEAVMDAEYLESDEGSSAIVAAAYVDRQLNGPLFMQPADEAGRSVHNFPERHPEIDLSALRDMAIEGFRRVMADNAELVELWEESGGGDTWRTGIEALIGRLAA